MCYILVRKEGYTYPVEAGKIIRFEACGSYTLIYLRNEEKARRECGHLLLYEERVRSSGLFIRIHKSHLVNCLEIARFDRERMEGVQIKDGTWLPLSEEGLAELMNFYEPHKTDGTLPPVA